MNGANLLPIFPSYAPDVSSYGKIKRSRAPSVGLRIRRSLPLKILFSFFKINPLWADYDAPVSEAGDYTDKYWATRELLASYNTLPISHPEPPAESAKQAYGSVKCDQYLNLEDLIQQLVSDKCLCNLISLILFLTTLAGRNDCNFARSHFDGRLTDQRR